MAQKLIATSAQIDAIAEGDTGSRVFTGWRNEIFGAQARRLCDGKIALTVSGNKIKNRTDGVIMANDFEDLVETFSFLDSWEDRYRHIIEIGKAMPALDAAFCVADYKVDGCASQVWLRMRVEKEPEFMGWMVRELAFSRCI